MNGSSLLEYEPMELKEAELENKIRDFPHLIEPGLVYIASQRRAGRGPLDLLLLDSGNAAVIAELKVQVSDDMLFQAMDYYDYVFSNLERLALAYEAQGLKIDPTQDPRLILIAPDFSPSLLNRCKWLDISLDLFRYRALTVKRESEILGELIDFIPVTIPSVPKREEVYTVLGHLDYITAQGLRDVAEQFLNTIRQWKDVRIDPVKSGLSLKVGKDVFAYFYTKRDGFDTAGYMKGREWRSLASVRVLEDLEEAVSTAKEAYENIASR